MSAKKARITTDGPDEKLVTDNPFGSLHLPNLPRNTASEPTGAEASGKAAAAPRKGPGLRVEIRREKSGRGGKTVTTLRGLASLDRRSTESLLFELKKKLGTGGSEISDGLQLQGDCREQVEEHLSRKGFRPVRAGG